MDELAQTYMALAPIVAGTATSCKVGDHSRGRPSYPAHDNIRGYKHTQLLMVLLLDHYLEVVFFSFFLSFFQMCHTQRVPYHYPICEKWPCHLFCFLELALSVAQITVKASGGFSR